jgi:hypothetical protein
MRQQDPSRRQKPYSRKPCGVRTPNLPHRNTHYPSTSPLHSLPIITTTSFLLSPTAATGRTLLSRPARRTVQRAGLYVPLIPIEQSNLHKLYTNRMKILIMASDTRERHPSSEPHPPVPRSPCTCRVSTTSPQKKRQATISSTGCVLQRVFCQR